MSFEFYNTNLKAPTEILQASATSQKLDKDFRKLLIWQLAIEIVHKVYEVLPQLPAEERYGMRAHLRKSAMSIPARIEEASGKSTKYECIQLMEISLNYVHELEMYSGIIQKKQWADEKVMTDLRETVKREQTMLTKFIEELNVR